MLDGLLLIGGAAVASAGVRGTPRLFAGDWIFQMHRMAGFFLMISTILVLLLRLRRPRPPTRRIARQPGAVACFAVAALKIAEDANRAIMDSLAREIGGPDLVAGWIWLLLADLGAASTAVVPILWAILKLGRIGRAEPGWIDCAGRTMGWAWIAWGLSSPVLLRVEAWIIWGVAGPLLPWVVGVIHPNS